MKTNEKYHKLLNSYLIQNPDELTDREGCAGNCADSSKRLKLFLADNGVDAELVMGIGYQGVMVNPAQTTGVNNTEEMRQYIGHVVVLISGRTVLDITYRQFGDEYEVGHIHNFAEFRQRWKKVQRKFRY